jgi:hypothetical protein
VDNPQDFQDKLHNAFDGRLRLRWSNQRGEYQIEQRVARGIVNFPAPDDQDEQIRLKDGYFYVMSIRNGDRMPCPKCHHTLKVPIREVRELKCGACEARGQDYRVIAGYYPLDDQLLNYLKMIDPLRGASKEMRARIDKHNAEFTDKQRDKVLTQLRDAAEDDFTRIAGIPTTSVSKIMPGTEGVRGA